MGGDEFVILLDGLNAETASAVGLRIRQSVELFDFNVNDEGQTTVVTLSMGLSVVAEDDTATTLYERADEALYKSKALGRNRLQTLSAVGVGTSFRNRYCRPRPQNPPPKVEDSYERFKASLTNETQIDVAH